MILRSDRDLTRFQIFDRLIAAAVAKLELKSLCAQCMGDNLMPKANAKSRVIFDQFFYRGVRVIHRARVTGAIGEKYCIWLEGINLSRDCARREDMHVESMMLQLTVNGQLSAKIERSHLEAWLLSPIIFHSKVCADHREGGRLLHFRIPAVGLLRCNFLYKIHSDETAKFSSSFDRFFLGDLLG